MKKSARLLRNRLRRLEVVDKELRPNNEDQTSDDQTSNG